MLARLHHLLFHLLMFTLTVLLAWLSGRYVAQWDWTRQGNNSLDAGKDRWPRKL